MLEWIVETQGYTVTELDTVGAYDAEIEERVAAFLNLGTSHAGCNRRAPNELRTSRDW